MADETTGTYRIPQSLENKLESDFEALRKRARKLKVQAPSYTILGTELEGADKVGYTRVMLVQVSGAAPKLKGWEFLGTVTTDPGVSDYLLSLVPGVELDRTFRESIDPLRCDHCHTNRYRKATYIVQNDKTGDLRLVGRSCLKDFLGHRSPEKVASYLTYVLDLMESFSSEDGEYGGGASAELLFPLDRFLSVTCLEARLFGFLTKGQAMEEDKSSTSTDVWATLNPYGAEASRAARRFLEKMEDVDKELAKETIEWVPSLWEDKSEYSLSDYVRNLKSSFETGLVSYKTSALVASTWAVFHKNQERKAERLVDTSKSQYVGEVKKRLKGQDVIILGTRWIETYYGDKQLVRMATPDGNVLLWWNTGEGVDVETGDKVKLDGTVKKHDAYKGTKQTTLNRCKIQEAK